MVHPIQPYFAISADKYYKRPLSATGIAHMYEYTCRNNSDNTTIAIPDGCIDVMFDTTSEDAAARAAGTVLTGTRFPMEQGRTYFGIRFEPGVMPDSLDGTFWELEDFTGYTSRCIDKIFKAYAGMSPSPDHPFSAHDRPSGQRQHHSLHRSGGRRRRNTRTSTQEIA